MITVWSNELRTHEAGARASAPHARGARAVGCARAMLRELELRVEAARGHERAMLHGLAKSHAWPDVADREWIASAATDAKADRERAAAAFTAAQALVADVFPDLDLDAAAIARCVCGATWALPARRVRGSRPGLHADQPRAMICKACGSTGRLERR